MLLTDDQRAALEAIVNANAEGDGFGFGALIEVLTGLGMAEEVLDEQNSDGLAALAECLLLVEAAKAHRCPHITGRTTQWCALGQTTAEADRALARMGAMYALEFGEHGLTDEQWMAVHTTLRHLRDNVCHNDETIMTRARELAPEVE